MRRFVSFLVFAFSFLHSAHGQQGAAAEAPVEIPPVTGPRVTLPHCSYIDIRVGSGEAATDGKNVAIHEKAWLGDGTKVLPVKEDVHGVIPLTMGRSATPFMYFDEGLAGMKIGGKRRIFLPLLVKDPNNLQKATDSHIVMTMDVDMLAVTGPPSFEDTYAFLMDMLKSHQGTQQTKTEPERDGSRSYFESKIIQAVAGDCKLTITTRYASPHGDRSRDPFTYELQAYDPAAVSVAPTKVLDGWRESSPTFSVRAEASSGKGAMDFSIDTEENAKRLQKALVHAISMCGGQKSLF